MSSSDSLNTILAILAAFTRTFRISVSPTAIPRRSRDLSGRDGKYVAKTHRSLSAWPWRGGGGPRCYGWRAGGRVLARYASKYWCSTSGNTSGTGTAQVGVNARRVRARRRPPPSRVGGDGTGCSEGGTRRRAVRAPRESLRLGDGHSAGDDSDDDGTRCNVRHVVRVRPLVARRRGHGHGHRRGRQFSRRRRRLAVDPRLVVHDVGTAGRMRVGRLRGVGAGRVRVHAQTTGHQQLRETLSGMSVGHDTGRHRRPLRPRTLRTLLLYVSGRARASP